ncbi:MAG: biotin transporter BioY [bacterium]
MPTSTMQISSIQSRYLTWRKERTKIQLFFMSLGMASLTGLLAQIKLYIPGTPVPITGQTLAILVSGVVLGQIWGTISQASYVGLGCLGIPWFSDFRGGVQTIIGPSGGYLIGFILATAFIGHCLNNYKFLHQPTMQLLLFIFANFIIIHGIGAIQLATWMHHKDSTWPTIIQTLNTGMLPFIPGDFIKISLATLITSTITKESTTTST